jgi:hypothetical protein
MKVSKLFPRRLPLALCHADDVALVALPIRVASRGGAGVVVHQVPPEPAVPADAAHRRMLIWRPVGDDRIGVTQARKKQDDEGEAHRRSRDGDLLARDRRRRWILPSTGSPPRPRCLRERSRLAERYRCSRPGTRDAGPISASAGRADVASAADSAECGRSFRTIAPTGPESAYVMMPRNSITSGWPTVR